MAKKKTKTEMATEELLRHDLADRGHAFTMLRKAGLHRAGGAVFNAAVRNYEAERGVSLGKSKSQMRHEENARLRALAYQMSADEVREEITNGATQLFWMCWKIFRDDGKWGKQLKVSDFAVNFKK